MALLKPASKPWRLPRPAPTVRLRLTIVYGTLFLLSGAALLAITDVLWRRAMSRPGLTYFGATSLKILRIATPSLGSKATAPATLVPVNPDGLVAKRLSKVAAQLKSVALTTQNSDLHQLLIWSGIALAIMAMFSIALGWLTAGRVLSPLRTITATARDISATNLHERLDLDGPADELKELGNTFDQLLGRLEHAFQSQRQFVANASHELRTPLATMRASLDVALAKPDPVPEQTRLLADRLGAELAQIDRLLESFLALALAQRGAVGEAIPMSLDLLAAAALEAQGDAIAALDLTISGGDCPQAWVSGSETLLARLVDNVIENAVHHNTRGGWIAIRTATEGLTARLVVENGGPLLEPRTVAELVQPFRRVGAERTGSESGFGLGLSIVAAIVESHGGRLELQARAEGGLRVIVDLPLHLHREESA